MSLLHRRLLALVASLALTLGAPALFGQAHPPLRPGPQGGGVTLLPNGWRIAPAGRHIYAGDLPLAMVLSPEGRHLVVTNNGWSKPTLTVVDLERMQIRQTLSLEHAWLGLAWHPDGRRLYSSGASDNAVNQLEWRDDRLSPAGALRLGPPQESPEWGRLENAGFVGGLAVSPDGRTLYAVQVYGKMLRSVDIATGRVKGTVQLAAEPYTVLLSADGRELYVSLWGGARVLGFEAEALVPRGEVEVGEHPNAMILSRNGDRLFVACANTNAVWAVALPSLTPLEQVSVALYPAAPAGSTPNALALSADGETLLVANADNNTVAVVDIARPAESEVRGFIPTGWYPTDVAFSRDGRQILVLSGKGLSSAANPRGPQPGAGKSDEYIAALLEGALSVLPTPTRAELQAMTARVYELTAYNDGIRLAPADVPSGGPIPGRVGEPSPIRHVFYVIRENRTYDQVLGDLPEGNGDPNLTLFGEQVTPNAHALAREFVLFDNFYVDAEVSCDGHAFSTAAYATDAVEKLWPTDYGDRGGLYLSEGGWEQRNPYGNLAAPADGYLWDFAARAGVNVRSYGEFASWDKKRGPVRASVPGLQGKVHPRYPPYDLSIPDGARVDIWIEEFRQFEANGGLPRLSIIRLGNDHTSGTMPGRPTPRSMVAENDHALGRVVETISHSRYWPESAIFILEDDAQNGPDHVDAHRSVLLVASPYARRGVVDSTLYTTSGVLRTMELILGLPPMSQYDAAATPMHAAFQREPVTTRYELRPGRVPFDEMNRADAPGAQASLAMDLDEADRAPEFELNEIVWKSIRGADSSMPPPVRSGFVRPLDGEHE